MFKAYEIAKKDGYDGKLYIIGDGPDKEKVEKLKEDNVYKDEIILLGRKENPYNWLKKADKFILSSKYEGLPTVLLESLCLNKETISSNCKTGTKEILDNNRGKIYKIGDCLKLSEYIMNNKPSEVKRDLKDFERTSTFDKFLEILEEKC